MRPLSQPTGVGLHDNRLGAPWRAENTEKSVQVGAIRNCSRERASVCNLVLIADRLVIEPDPFRCLESAISDEERRSDQAYPSRTSLPLVLVRRARELRGVYRRQVLAQRAGHSTLIDEARDVREQVMLLDRVGGA